MSEGKHGSSGGGTAVIVIAILGGLLLVGLSCGGIILGAGFFLYRSAENVQMEAVRVRDEAQLDMEEANQEMKKLQDQMKKEMDAIKIPEGTPLVPPPETAPDSSLPPAEDTTK